MMEMRLYTDTFQIPCIRIPVLTNNDKKSRFWEAERILEKLLFIIFMTYYRKFFSGL